MDISRCGLLTNTWGNHDVFRLCKEKTEDGKRRFDQIVIESTGEMALGMIVLISIMCVSYCRFDRMHIRINLVVVNNVGSHKSKDRRMFISYPAFYSRHFTLWH